MESARGCSHELICWVVPYVALGMYAHEPAVGTTHAPVGHEESSDRATHRIGHGEDLHSITYSTGR